MDDVVIKTADYKPLAIEILQRGSVLRCQAHGGSMSPFIRDGDWLEVEPPGAHEIRRGDIVLCTLENGRLVAHRVVRLTNHAGQALLLVQGDRFLRPDGLVPKQNVLGRVIAVRHRGRRLDVQSASHRFLSSLWMALSPFSRLLFLGLAALRSRLIQRLGPWIP